MDIKKAKQLADKMAGAAEVFRGMGEVFDAAVAAGRVPAAKAKEVEALESRLEGLRGEVESERLSFEAQLERESAELTGLRDKLGAEITSYREELVELSHQNSALRSKHLERLDKIKSEALDAESRLAEAEKRMMEIKSSIG